MTTPSEHLATALEALKVLQDQGVVAIRSSQLSRAHRERLLKNGFLREVVKGWYLLSQPQEVAGDSTAWYTSFWGFCANYLDERFGHDWCLSPEQSLALLTGDWTVPKQLQVRSSKGGNKPLTLPHMTSLIDLRLALPPESDMELVQGLRVFSLSAALIASSPTQFAAQPTIMRAALAALTDASVVLGQLLEGGHSTIAGRLAGALRHMGRQRMADDILDTMRAAGYSVYETDPFKGLAAVALASQDARPASARVHRLCLLWQQMRPQVLEHFPAPPTPPPDRVRYLRQVDEVYVTDAYHSLSIEGYRVSADLIERVRSGDWNPDSSITDRDQRDALAARGYWQAFQRVRHSVDQVLRQHHPAEIARADHGIWYRELFGPSVNAGLLRPADLAGYRSGAVFIRRSMHIPPSCDAVRELMPTFFDLLQQETEPAVRVVLGHFMFVYIHPYLDGNGRIGRFLMNLMLAAGGYPWTVVPVERRAEYMHALEQASTQGDITAFARFLGALVRGSSV